jgi:hypothetical protein
VRRGLEGSAKPDSFLGGETLVDGDDPAGHGLGRELFVDDLVAALGQPGGEAFIQANLEDGLGQGRRVAGGT